MPPKPSLLLALPESQQSTLRRHPLLQEANSRFREQRVNIHYDTRRLHLRKERIVLQLREQSSYWIQTAERQKPASSGLVERKIWSAPYLHHFDFSTIEDIRLRQALESEKISGHLIPVFETSFHRTSWHVEPAIGVKISVVLDRGWIAAHARRAPLSELTLELDSGSVDDLYLLAMRLAERVALSPLPMSRAERGYEMYQDNEPRPAIFKGLKLDPETPPLTIFRRVALSCLAGMHHNQAGAISGTDPEYVHQMRISLRRLRTAIRLFKPMLPEDFADQTVPDLRVMGNTLGRVRDLDVLLKEIVLPVIAAQPDEPCLADLAAVLAERQHIARTEVAQYLSAPEYSRQMLVLGRLLNSSRFADAKSGHAGDLNAFASRRLYRLHRNVRRLAARARIDKPASLHDLRIAVKHLRYGSELFGHLIDTKRNKAMRKQMLALQDELGQLNDLANAGSTLMTCSATNQALHQAIGLIADWHGKRHLKLLQKIGERLKKLEKQGIKSPERP